MGSDEDGMLAFTAQTRELGSRLSCQIMLTEALDGLQVKLPASQY
jgi:2Fe-2S ferredoxin